MKEYIIFATIQGKDIEVDRIQAKSKDKAIQDAKNRLKMVYYLNLYALRSGTNPNNLTLMAKQ